MLESKIRQTAVVATPAITPAPASPERVATPTIAAHPFAEVLRQNRLAAARPPTSSKANDKAAPAPAPKPQSNESTAAEPATSQRNATQAKTRTTADPARAPASADGDKLAGSQASTASSTDLDPNTDARARDASTAATGAPTDAATLASAQAAAPQSAELRPGDAHATVAPNDEPIRDSSAANKESATALLLDSGAAQVATAGATGDRRMNVAADDDAAAKSALASDKTADAATTGSFATLLAETKSSPAESSPAGRTSDDFLAPAAQPTGFAAPAAPGTGNAAAASTVPVPIHSAEFAAAFGMQVSVLAKDGIQHAELHLNPAEMGPVSVQITLDGTQARVDFGADAAATRHAIEAGLPELASALRDAGFTLAGGGVAQHSSSSSGDDGSGRGTSSAPPAAAVASLDAAAQRLNRRASAGGIDVYA